MSERRTIRHAWHDDGYVVSRVGSDVAWPVLDWDAMQPSNNFDTTYNLEKFSVLSVAGDDWDKLTWTRKVPVGIKNQHRAFWRMKPLRVEVGI